MSGAFPAGLERRLKTKRVGRSVVWLEHVDSTNERALDLGGRGAPDGMLVGAEFQSAGRGRDGRRWICPAGQGLTFSVLLRAELPVARLVRATLAVSVAVCEALRVAGLAGAHIKWPNDVLVGHAKIAGLLSETRACGELAPFVVVGIGLNVNQAPEELPEGATSWLAETGRPGDRLALLAAILDGLEPAWTACTGGRFQSVKRHWEELSPWHRGHRVRVEQDGSSFEGVTAGLTDEGFLQVRRGDGRRVPVVAGGIEFL